MGTESENTKDRELTDSELNEVSGGDHNALAQSLLISVTNTIGAAAGVEGGAGGAGSGVPIATGAAAGVTGGTRGPKPA